MIEELVEKLGKKELSKDDYPCLNDPSPTFHGTAHSAVINEAPPAYSMRSRWTPTWARPRSSDDGYSRSSCHFFVHRCTGVGLKQALSDFKKMGQCIFVFIFGGGRFEGLSQAHSKTE